MKSLLKHIVVFILTWEARIALWKYKPSIVGITGSVGKTSTKDAVYSVLKAKYRVRKSEKSFNSELGVPLTVLGLPNAWNSLWGWMENILDGLALILTHQDYPEWLVLEIGADHPGDIVAVTRWIKPNITVLTRFPEVPVHVEFFDSREAVIEEKRALRRALVDDGTLVLNADDELVADEPVAAGQHRLTYGFSKLADVRGSRPLIRYSKSVPRGISCTVTFLNERQDLLLEHTVGAHHLAALLAAITVGVSEGMTLAHAIQALGNHAAPPGRMRILPGTNSSTLIDDTYNSSPIAALSALETLSDIKCTGRRIAILGDMMELGEYSSEEHEKLGRAAAAHADMLVAVGIRMQTAATAAREAGMHAAHVHVVADSTAAADLLKTIIGAGDIVLCKGSQSMRMERTVEALLEKPEVDKDKLVRQDAEWKAR